MHQFEHLRLHPERPQIRQIRRAVSMLQQGLFVIVPTDTTYVIMCRPESSGAINDIRKLRQLDSGHLWSVVCSNLSQAATCVCMDNRAHRILSAVCRGLTPLFYLPALLCRVVFLANAVTWASAFLTTRCAKCCWRSMVKCCCVPRLSCRKMLTYLLIRMFLFPR